MAILSVSGVRKSFGGLVVLDGVDMELDAGRVYQLMGPNGSGKTTLINVISGALMPDSGSVIFEGTDIARMGMLDTYRLGLARTFQVPQAFTKLTALENAMTAGTANSGESYARAPIHRLWRRDEERIMREARSSLAAAGLQEKHDTPSGNLSGGQLKLLELAKSTMGSARMLLMDEPIAGVNPALAHEIFDMIHKMAAEQHVTFLIIEHRLDISLQYADHVFAMDRGRIIAEGGADEVLSDKRVGEAYLGK